MDYLNYPYESLIEKKKKILLHINPLRCTLKLYNLNFRIYKNLEILRIIRPSKHYPLRLGSYE